MRSMASFSLFSLISFCTSSPLDRLRHTITTVAPICANPNAVALPMPELAPVTMQTFPSMLVFDVGIWYSFRVFGRYYILAHVVGQSICCEEGLALSC